MRIKKRVKERAGDEMRRSNLYLKCGVECWTVIRNVYFKFSIHATNSTRSSQRQSRQKVRQADRLRNTKRQTDKQTNSQTER